VSGERPQSPIREWQITTGAHFWHNKHTSIQNLQYPPPPQFHRLMTSVVEASTKKKKILIFP